MPQLLIIYYFFLQILLNSIRKTAKPASLLTQLRIWSHVLPGANRVRVRPRTFKWQVFYISYVFYVFWKKVKCTWFIFIWSLHYKSISNQRTPVVATHLMLAFCSTLCFMVCFLFTYLNKHSYSNLYCKITVSLYNLFGLSVCHQTTRLIHVFSLDRKSSVLQSTT